MKLSTRGRYGVRTLIDLAMRWGDGPVQLKDIAQNQDISLQYLEHLMRPLVAAGLVRSMRGARGGVWLARAPEGINLAEVINALVGSIAPVECVDDIKVCNRSEYCVARDVWCEVKTRVNEVLESKTLKDLVVLQKTKGQNPKAMYFI